MCFCEHANSNPEKENRASDVSKRGGKTRVSRYAEELLEAKDILLILSQTPKKRKRRRRRLHNQAMCGARIPKATSFIWSGGFLWNVTHPFILRVPARNAASGPGNVSEPNTGDELQLKEKCDIYRLAISNFAMLHNVRGPGSG